MTPPAPYHISEPIFEDGLWCFWLTANDDIIHYVLHLDFIILPPKFRILPGLLPSGRTKYAISPRYIFEEAWIKLQECLDMECNNVDLSPSIDNFLTTLETENK